MRLFWSHITNCWKSHALAHLQYSKFVMLPAAKVAQMIPFYSTKMSLELRIRESEPGPCLEL